MVSNMSNWGNISRDRASRIRAEVVGAVKNEVRAELEPVIREQVEEELWDKAREQVAQEAKEAAQQERQARSQAVAEARRELESEARSEEPSARLKRGFVEFVKETEVDAHAQAVVASGSAGQSRSKLKWSRRTFGAIPWLLFAGAVPLLYADWMYTGSLTAPAFLAASAGLLVVFLTVLVGSVRRHGRLERSARDLEQISSDYLIMAERAKSYRLVHAERLETKGRLDELTGSLRDAKEKLDKRFHPPVSELDGVRESVRHRIEVTTMPSPEEEFDERLAEAEAAEDEEAEAQVA